jgi:hypothetical protein
VSGDAIEEAGCLRFLCRLSQQHDCDAVHGRIPRCHFGYARSTCVDHASSWLNEKCGCHVPSDSWSCPICKRLAKSFYRGTGAAWRMKMVTESERTVQFGNGTSPGPLTQRLQKLVLDLRTGGNYRQKKKYRDMRASNVWQLRQNRSIIPKVAFTDCH